MVATLGEMPDHFLVVADQEARLSEQANRLGEVALVRAIDELFAALTAIREGDEARMTVELALLRAAKPEIDPSRAALNQRIERLESAAAGTAPAPADPGPPRPRDSRRLLVIPAGRPARRAPRRVRARGAGRAHPEPRPQPAAAAPAPPPPRTSAQPAAPSPSPIGRGRGWAVSASST